MKQRHKKEERQRDIKELVIDLKSYGAEITNPCCVMNLIWFEDNFCFGREWVKNR